MHNNIIMLDFLSNESWLRPQIDYLLFLQNLRLHVGPLFDSFFMCMTKFGEVALPTLVISIIYWCFDLKAGIYLFTLNSLGLLVAQFLKMTACVYRPWILSDKIKPIDAAFRFAPGYSFPSGHSMTASTVWGGVAYLIAKKHKFACIALILLILMVGFSRNYLGVHTPQDVFIGLLTGLILIFVINYLINWCEKDKNRYLYLMAGLNIIVLANLFYILTKNYPVDYLNGEILVKPQNGMYISVLYTGWILGLSNGTFLCRRFFPFEPKKISKKARIIIGTLGILLLSILLSIIETQFFDIHRSYSTTLIGVFSIGFTITGIYPFIFTRFLKKRN